jgi:mannosyl-oligosaccharide alpha-1,2-mannosidase
MRSLSLGGSAAAALLVSLAAAAPPFKPHGPHEQPQYIVNEKRAGAVKEAFQVSWDGYYKHAFRHDSLRPVTNGWEDDRSVLFPRNLPHGDGP